MYTLKIKNHKAAKPLLDDFKIYLPDLAVGWSGDELIAVHFDKNTELLCLLENDPHTVTAVFRADDCDTIGMSYFLWVAGENPLKQLEEIEADELAILIAKTHTKGFVRFCESVDFEEWLFEHFQDYMRILK